MDEILTEEKVLYLQSNESESQWYKDAIIYEIHVRACYDSNGDGIGDFRGLTEKLPYIKDLGATAIWLLPFYPSPLRDDGYDIASYTSINPIYGSLEDFKSFLGRAHSLGIKVITELVINHTSDQHPWFQRARRAPVGSVERDFYVWNDSPKKYEDTRIIFTDFEPSNWTWDPVAKAYYWHRFYHHQPDLNFENPKVHEALFNVVDFWFNLGVDGMRLDAIPYLYEREGTNCENLPETHQFLKKLRAHVDSKFDNKMLLAEANQWPEDAIEYFGEGDECHMSFHFPLMPRLFMSLKMEDRYPIIDILEQTPEPPTNCAWAIFLRNHDELTLEMVTDEERDYMYRLYAADTRARINLGIRRRLTPLLNNDRRSVELLNGLLFSMKGTPVIYYGDEIGMGDNIYLGDRDGVRTPFQWSSDRNAGFSNANPQQLYLPINIDYQYHYVSINVESQTANPTSLLWWMKSLISLRKDSPALRRGSIRMLHPENRKVLCYLREHEDQTVLVVANLSGYAEAVELELSEFAGRIPREMFGQTDFPPIGELPYFLTLGGHSFYWFSLQKSKAGTDDYKTKTIPSFPIHTTWEVIFKERYLQAFLSSFKESIVRMRWFSAKARKIRNIQLIDKVPFNYKQGRAFILLLEFNYYTGEPENYLIPISYAKGANSQKILNEHPEAVILKLPQEGADQSGVIIDATILDDFNYALLENFAIGKSLPGDNGHITFSHNDENKGKIRSFLEVQSDKDGDGVHLLRGEQSNTSVIFRRDFILKLFRKIEVGLNPDLEITSHLTALQRELSIPTMYGSFQYETNRKDSYSLGFVQGYIENEGTAWNLFLDNLKTFYPKALARIKTSKVDPVIIIKEEISLLTEYTILLAKRTAQIHDALAADDSDSNFAPLPFSELYQRSLYQTINTEADQTLDLLAKNLDKLSPHLKTQAEYLIRNHKQIVSSLKEVFKTKVFGSRIRTHGDFHLGQVLFTGKDFIIIDFEGEPARPLTERKIKRSPLRDVAGMLRSLHYVANFALYQSSLSIDDEVMVHPIMEQWIELANDTFTKAYTSNISSKSLIPQSERSRQLLLNFFLLEKVLYEIRYELNNRPEWVGIPLTWLTDFISRVKEDGLESA